MAEIVVGKNVLESLTTGMYSDPKVLFREYIQNATDAIDEAIKHQILKEGNSCIDIKLNKDKRQIIIRDNGTGIPANEAFKILGDVGNSIKDHREQRGFRGIGRLGGLPYCDNLYFITTYKGEDVETTIIWDCVKLKKLLQPNEGKNMDLIQVIAEVTSVKKHKVNSDSHYFKVQLEGVSSHHTELLELKTLKNFLSQAAPVPFDYQSFTMAKYIKDEFQKEGLVPEEYNVYLNKEQIFKPYKRKVLVDQKKNKKDFIEDIEFFKAYKNDGKIWFFGWYGSTELSGSIKENDVNAIRARKKNILIGDNHTLDPFFGDNSTYRGFNRWFIGELYIYDDFLIPNARRDDFEQNDNYFQLKKEVEKTTKDYLAKLPHRASNLRTVTKQVEQSPKKLEELEDKINKGLTNKSKDSVKKEIEEQKSKLKKAEKNIEKAEKKANPSKTKNLKKKTSQNIKKAEELEEKFEEAFNKWDRIPSSYPKNVRKVISQIFDVIDNTLPEGQAYELQERIIEDLIPSKKNKNGKKN